MEAMNAVADDNHNGNENSNDSNNTSNLRVHTSTSRHRTLNDDEIISFITDDVCVIPNAPINQSRNPAESPLLQVGRSGNNELRKCYFKLDLPDLSEVEVTSIQLCIYQYFARSASSQEDFIFQYFNSINWDENSSFYPNPVSGLTKRYTISSTSEGKKCVYFGGEHLDQLQESLGVIFKAVYNSPANTDRYFYSSEWTSNAMEVTEPASSTEFHPHWVINTRERTEATSFPSPASFSTLITGESPESPINNSEPTGEPVDSKGMNSVMMIGIAATVGLCIIAMSIIFIRRKKNSKQSRILRTFITEEDISRKDKYSFNSMNSSYKADSGYSGNSFRWIENVKLDDGGGDRTVCNKIDQKIDNAVFPTIQKEPTSQIKPKSQGKPTFSSRLRSSTPTRIINAVTPKLKNSVLPQDNVERGSTKKGSNSNSNNNNNSTRNVSFDDSQQKKARNDSANDKFRDRIKARKRRFLKYGNESNSILESSMDDTYPSLISSYPSSGDEESQGKKRDDKNCLDELVSECHATKEDVKCMWKGDFDNSESDQDQTYTMASTLDYTTDDSSNSYPTYAKSEVKRYM
jgi:hypothetical protein